MILLETKWLAHGRHFIKSVCFVVFFLVLVQGSQSVMASSLFKKPQAKGKHFALIIGHNGGSRFLKPLLFAKQDAKRMSKLLVELGGYKKNEVKLLLSPDLKQIQKTMKQLKQLYKGQEKKGSFFFYYSGHARPGYFQLGEELLAFKKMVHFVKSLPVKLRFIIIDSCYSGSVLGVGSKGLKWANSIGWKKRRFQKKIKGFVILTSSGANSRSFESKRLRSSFFTSSLLAGLRGAADSDNDKRISLSELRRYVYQQTLAHSTRHKTPFQRPSSRIDIRGGQHIYLTYLQQAHSRMTLRQNFQGHVFLFREGKLVHEFKKEQNKITTIAVNPGSYQIQIRYKNQLGLLNKNIIAKKDYILPYNKVTWQKVTYLAQARGADGSLLSGVRVIPRDEPSSHVGIGMLGNYTFFNNLSTNILGITLQLDLPKWVQIEAKYSFSSSNSMDYEYNTHHAGLALSVGYGIQRGKLASWLGVSLQPNVNMREISNTSERLTNFALALGLKGSLDYYIMPHWAVRLNIDAGGDLVFFTPSPKLRPFFSLSAGLLFRI